VLLSEVIPLPLRIGLLAIFLGVLVQDCPDGLVASSGLEIGSSSDDRHGHVASATLWRDRTC
jgi:hypothetical protein